MREMESKLYPVTRTSGHWVSRRLRPPINRWQLTHDGDELMTREEMVWDFWVMPDILKRRIRRSLGFKASKVETGK